MTAIMLRSVDLEAALLAAYRSEPSCRLVERAGSHFAVFRDRESQTVAIVDIRQVALQIRGAKS